MEITLLHTDDCPHVELAERRVRAAAGERLPIVRLRIETREHAQAAGFTGSPTILVDGHDPFTDTSPASPHRADDPNPGPACRLYATPDGPQGAPTVEQLRAALHRLGRGSARSK